MYSYSCRHITPLSRNLPLVAPSTVDLPRGVSGVVDRDETTEKVCDEMDGLRLDIDFPAVDGEGLGRFVAFLGAALGLLLSAPLPLLRKLRN